MIIINNLCMRRLRRLPTLTRDRIPRKNKKIKDHGQEIKIGKEVNKAGNNFQKQKMLS
jgi:hypothetical protein